jgi:hypothetical protein
VTNSPREFRRQDVLEAMLQQSASTIEFLHECLTNPPREGKNGGFVYAYPEQTIAWLEEIRAAVPERQPCFHSKMVEGCEGCADGARWRAVMAYWRESRG